MASTGHHTSLTSSSPSSSSPPSFHTRSQTASQIPTWDYFDQSTSQSPNSRHHRTLSDKNLPSIPTTATTFDLDIPSFDTDFHLDTSIFQQGKPTVSTQTQSDAPSSTSANPIRRLSFARVRTGPIAERPRSWFPSAKTIKSFTTDADAPQPHDDTRDRSNSRESMAFVDQLPPLERSMTSTDSFASFAKRSWKSASRSTSAKERPSTANMENYNEDGKLQETANSKPRPMRKRQHLMELASLPRPSMDGGKATTPKALVKASNYFTKLKHKQNTPVLSSGTDSDASSATSVMGPASTSTEARTSQSTSESECATADECSNNNNMPSRDRDPLWSSFKMLDVEFKGFTSKPMSHRITQVQEVLMPFLCRTTPDMTVKELEAEDVDRRASILNKWWSAILEMLDGQGQQPIPGVDRPFLLETAIMIMMRAEWRQTTPNFLPLVDRTPPDQIRRRTYTNSTTSTLSSSQAAFLAESAEHNVRTMFVTNLVKQMSIVVDKMSLRHVPPSLINFAGKTCSYAFFFAPGVADILTKLWELTPDLIRRTGDAFDLPRRSKCENDGVVALFPSNLASFGWSSHRRLADMLKQESTMPLLVSKIAWRGPWVSRWKGRDTDLFFIFCKYYHVLADQFIVKDLPLREKAKSPGFVLIQAQLLSIMDSTIHRHAAMQQAQQLPLMDSLNGVDASALAMQMPSTNMMKPMGDNTLVVLLSNVLSDEASDVQGAKQTFAEAFELLMKAATYRTSRYDNASCFSLCEFLEECFRLYDDHEHLLKLQARTDWSFWIDVFKKILSSYNTMSEVRLLSFIFSIWDIIARDPSRKTMLCRDWLLTPETFEELFNHWCPMVRAYYHRLLCWRICRDVGRANEGDTEIWLAVSERLNTVWAHYLFLKHDAASAGRLSPSTAPTLPTPGKKFIIIRQELNAPQPGLFMGFDSFNKLPGSTTTTLDAVDSEADDRPDGKKRWSLLGKMLGFSSGEGNDRDSDFMEHDPSKANQDSESSSAPPRPPPKPSARSDSLGSAPIYEEQKHVFRFILGWQQPAAPPRDRMLTKPRLPGPAQARVTARLRGDTAASPFVASKPAATRKISGSSGLGLINGAKNASTVSEPTESASQRPSATLARTVSTDSADGSLTSEDTAFLVLDEVEDKETDTLPLANSMREPMTTPVKPEGFYKKNAVYCGRALAEWSLVIFECNNFVDRRRQEGVLGLSEVEVPILGMEGFRKLGG